MSDINRTFQIGNLVKDAQLKYTVNEKAKLEFTIANNRRKKVGDQYIDNAYFFDIEIWGKYAETMESLLKKGNKIAVDGELIQKQFQDTVGNKRSRILIRGTNIQLLSKKETGGSGD